MTRVGALLMLLPWLFNLSCASTKQDPSAASTGASILVEQSQQVMEEEGGVLNLARSPFHLIFHTPKKSQIWLNASESPRHCQKTTHSDLGSLLKLFHVSRAIAEPKDGNPELGITITDGAAHAWTCGDPTANRFNETVEEFGGVRCRRTVFNLSMQEEDPPRSVPIAKAPERVYLTYWIDTPDPAQGRVGCLRLAFADR